MSMTDDIEIGPIDYFIVEWPPDRKPTGEALPLVVDLVDRGIVRILDFAFIQKQDDGTVVAIDLNEFGSEMMVFDGASSGILGQDDYDEAGEAMENGASAALLVYENTWAAPFATALRKGGARLVAAGRIPVNEFISALDELEGSE